MVAGDAKVKRSNPVFADSIPQAGTVLDSVESVAQKKLAVATAVRQMIDESWLNITIGTGHREGSNRRFVLESEKGQKIFTQGPSRSPLVEASSD
jgi:hypothetical protein